MGRTLLTRMAVIVFAVFLVISTGHAENFYRCTKGGQTWFSNHRIPGARCTVFLKFVRPQHQVGKRDHIKVKPVNHAPSVKAMDLEKLEALIDEASVRFSIPKALIRAVITVESGFKPYVVSNVGAQGLMQLMPATAKVLGVTNAFDPRQNVMGGTRLLRRLADMFQGDLKKTLAAYYCGPSAVIRHGGIPDPDTRGYVNRIIAYYLKYSGMGKPHAGTKGTKKKKGVANGKD